MNLHFTPTLKTFFFSIAAVSLLTLSGLQVKASHMMGQDLSYVCVSPTKYIITANFYRDCAGIPAPTTGRYELESTACSFDQDPTLTLQNVGGTEVSPLCIANIGSSTCNGGTLPGVEVWTFTDTITIGVGDTCADWVWSTFYSGPNTVVCCRNGAIDNITGGAQYIEATMTNKFGVCNNSPVFTSLPTPYICINEVFNYNHGAVDADGDSLVYYFTQALGNAPPAGILTYVSPFTYSLPIASNPVMTLDSITGQMTMKPNLIMNAVVTMKIEEWRYIGSATTPSMVGTTMRDLQIVVLNCTNTQPVVPAAGMQSVTGGFKTDSFTVEVCVGDSVRFTFLAVDSNGDNITIASNVGTSIPGATFIIPFPNSTVESTFAWRPTGADVGYNGFVVTVQDDGCPVLGAQWYVFNIQVIDGTYGGPDKVSCGGDTVQLTATGGSTFTWTAILPGTTLEMSSTTIYNPKAKAAPIITTDYIVTSDLSANCDNVDTVRVTQADAFAMTMSPDPDTTICKNEVAAISGAGDGTYLSYTYSWSPTDSLGSPTSNSTFANPTSNTQYVLTAIATSGCYTRDTVDVLVVGEAPNISLSADITNLCVGGDSIQFTVNNIGLCGTRTCPGATTVYHMDTSGSSSNAPFASTSSKRSQFLYLATDLRAMGMETGAIRKIAFETNSVGSSHPFTGMTLSMGCTNDVSLTVAGGFLSTTQVFATASYGAAIGWDTLVLDDAYMWDSTSNLIVEFCYDGSSNLAGSYTFSSVTSPGYFCKLTANVTCGSTPPVTSGASLLGIAFLQSCQNVYRYGWSPTTGITDTTIYNPKALPVATTTYTVYVTDTMNTNCVSSDFLTINVGPAFTLSSTADPVTVCIGDPSKLSTVPSAAGTYTYLWTPNGFLNFDTISNPFAYPSSPTTFYVAVTSAAGCMKSDTIDVAIEPGAPSVVISALPNDSICALTGDTATLEATISPGLVATCTTGGYDTCTTTASNDSIAGPTNGTNNLHGSANLTGLSVKKQHIFLRSELNSIGMLNGDKITAVAFAVVFAGGDVADMVVGLECTSLADFSGGAFVSSVTEVKSSFTYKPVVQAGTTWDQITFDNPYVWNGDSNLVLEICQNTMLVGASTTNRTLSAAANRSLLKFDFATGACNASGPSSSAIMPLVKFVYCAAASIPSITKYTWSPTTSLSTTADDSVVKVYPSVLTSYVVTVEDSLASIQCLNSAVIAIYDTCNCELDSPYIVGSPTRSDTATFVDSFTFKILISEGIRCDSIDGSGIDFMLDTAASTTTTAEFLLNSIDSAYTVPSSCINDTSAAIYIKLTNKIPITYADDWLIAPSLTCNITDGCGNLMLQAGAAGLPGGATGAAVILPIELLYFTGELIEDNVVLLKWETATEVNRNQFDIQRSRDGKSFENIGVEQARGAYYPYNFKDLYPNEGVNYYRLRQIDLDGRYAFSTIVAIDISKVGFSLLSVKPIPTLDKLHISFNTNNTEVVNIEIVNLLGEKVVQHSVKPQIGENELILELDNIESGVYYLNMHNARNEKILRKIIKQ